MMAIQKNGLAKARISLENHGIQIVTIRKRPVPHCFYTFRDSDLAQIFFTKEFLAPDFLHRVTIPHGRNHKLISFRCQIS